MSKYILSIDQSTSSTKVLLFDENGHLFARSDLPHRQIINDKGWVEHDPNEIWNNILKSIKKVIQKSGIDKSSIICVGLSNQRETSIVWDKTTGVPLFNSIVWQCGRGELICKRIRDLGKADIIKHSTGLNLSPYFSAAKFAWVLENVSKAQSAAKHNNVCCSTMDSWLIYKMTNGESIITDYSNASRTQLMNIRSLNWDHEICSLFGINLSFLPEICDSNSLFGYTDFDGILDYKIPIHSVMGDSHGSLFAQGCLQPGMIKATYGTGSSVMMNIGKKPVFSEQIVTSIAWCLDGSVNYVLEGNINYTGAVIKWMADDLGLIKSPKEAGDLAKRANQVDGLYLVPAFSGLGAPYWDSNARAIICGIDRNCGKAEIIRAAEECIAYQITDIIRLMEHETGLVIDTLRVDGGPTSDSYLMQFQADIANLNIIVPQIEELSGMGAAYAAGIAIGFYNPDTIFMQPVKAKYTPCMDEQRRNALYAGWLRAVKKTQT